MLAQIIAIVGVLLGVVLGLGAGYKLGWHAALNDAVRRITDANNRMNEALRWRQEAEEAQTAALTEKASTELAMQELESARLDEAVAAGLISPPAPVPVKSPRNTCGCGHNKAFHVFRGNKSMNCNQLMIDSPNGSAYTCKCNQFVLEN